MTTQHPAWQTITKVPRLTIYFWIVKILTTAMGEATSDFLVNRFNPYLAVMLGFIVLVVGLIIQFSVRKYIAGAYWFAAVAVSISGTMGADVLHVGFGIPYIVSASFYAVVLAAIFIIWYRSEKTLSIHSIYTRRREMFYWATILTTFALGTATGDLTATTLKLGYFVSGLLFIGIFAVPALAYLIFRANAIFTFWFAYILTRPLGASFADWFGKSKIVGGLGVGSGTISVILTLLIIAFVGYLTITGKDLQSRS